jgi:hypothetical protein
VSGGAARWLIALAVLAVVVGAAWALTRRRDIIAAITPRAETTLWLLGATAALSLIGFAVAAVIGLDIFTQRYLTMLIVLVAPVMLAAITVYGGRVALAIACALLALVGLGNGVHRLAGQFEPSLAPVKAAVAAAHPRTVLTDTPIALYYLSGWHPIFDRPSGLGPGLAASCLRPCAIVDDTRTHGGTPRPLRQPVASRLVGPYEVLIEP